MTPSGAATKTYQEDVLDRLARMENLHLNTMSMLNKYQVQVLSRTSQIELRDATQDVQIEHLQTKVSSLTKLRTAMSVAAGILFGLGMVLGLKAPAWLSGVITKVH